MDEFSILRGSNNMALILEFSAAIDFVEFKWFKRGTRFTWGWRVLWTNWWKFGDVLME